MPRAARSSRSILVGFTRLTGEVRNEIVSPREAVSP
jgi:hypothetical protein